MTPQLIALDWGVLNLWDLCQAHLRITPKRKAIVSYPLILGNGGICCAVWA